MEISIVTTTFNSAKTIVEFIQRSVDSVQRISKDYEIIVIDDGSIDETKAKVKEVLDGYKGLHLIELSRNFGHHEAILTGLSFAKGEYVFLIDSDLEESPELLIDFWNQISDSNFDVVYGISPYSKRNLLQQFLSLIFWKVFRRYTKLRIPDGICTVRIMKESYVRELLQFKEVNVFLAGLFEITGFNQVAMNIDKEYKGSSSYTLRKKFEMALTSMISFSGRPLRAIALFGGTIVATASVMIITLIMRAMLGQSTLGGWLSIVTLIVLFGGIQILSIGILAIYVASILEEVKRRPRAIVSHTRSSQEE